MSIEKLNEAISKKNKSISDKNDIYSKLTIDDLVFNTDFRGVDGAKLFLQYEFMLWSSRLSPSLVYLNSIDEIKSKISTFNELEFKSLMRLTLSSLDIEKDEFKSVLRYVEYDNKGLHTLIDRLQGNLIVEAYVGVLYFAKEYLANMSLSLKKKS